MSAETCLIQYDVDNNDCLRMTYGTNRMHKELLESREMAGGWIQREINENGTSILDSS